MENGKWEETFSMRIIAGEFRSRQLLAPETDATRPITDRAKQSLFDILQPYIPDARVYDCFAGTGSMGLECLSRGAAHVTFFEAERSAAALLRKNIDSLRVRDRSNIIDRDIFNWFDTAGADGRVDVVFLDPPYRFLTERPDDLARLAAKLAAAHLSPEGILIFRHDAGDALALPPLATFDQRMYGGMKIELMRRVPSN